MKVAFPLLVLMAMPSVYADPFLFLEDRGPTPTFWGWIPPGLHTYDLTVDTAGLDWSIADMSIDIAAGEVWQQGDRILISLGEDLEQIVVIPTAAEAFGLDAGLFARLGFQQV